MCAQLLQLLLQAVWAGLVSFCAGAARAQGWLRRRTLQQHLGGLALALLLSVGLNVWMVVYRGGLSTERRDGEGPAAASGAADACHHRVAVLAQLGHDNGHDDDSSNPELLVLHQACYAHQMLAAFSCRAQQRGDWTRLFPGSLSSAASSSSSSATTTTSSWPPRYPTAAGLSPALQRLVRARLRGAEEPGFGLYDAFGSTGVATPPAAIVGALAALHREARNATAGNGPARAVVRDLVHVLETAAAVLLGADERAAYHEWLVPAVEDAARYGGVGGGWWHICDALGDVRLNAAFRQQRHAYRQGPNQGAGPTRHGEEAEDEDRRRDRDEL